MDEVGKCQLPDYVSIRHAYGENALLGDRLIISDQLLRIERLLEKIVYLLEIGEPL